MGLMHRTIFGAVLVLAGCSYRFTDWWQPRRFQMAFNHHNSLPIRSWLLSSLGLPPTRCAEDMRKSVDRCHETTGGPGAIAGAPDADIDAHR